MGNVLIIAEHTQGQVKKTAHELLTVANRIASELGGQAEALVIGANADGLADQLAQFGAKKVYTVTDANLEKYNSIAYAKAAAAAVKESGASVVLASASPFGKDLAPRVAIQVQAGLGSDCVDLKVDAGKVVATRPIYAGKALVDVTVNTAVQLFTIRPNSFGAGELQSGASAEAVAVSADLGELRAAMKELVEGKSDRPDLTEAEIIISGGRSMKSADNFAIFNDVADALGAAVGASRAAVDSGYAPHDMQVGQTGKVVNPKLYVACGISGAIQHLAGMRNSKVIVAINKDPEAPIFQKADYGIVGDLFDAVPLFTQEVKKIL